MGKLGIFLCREKRAAERERLKMPQDKEWMMQEGWMEKYDVKKGI